MGIRRPLISKKIGKHRYALLKDQPLSYYDALKEANKLRDKGKSARVIKLMTGWFIYYYPQ